MLLTSCILHHIFDILNLMWSRGHKAFSASNRELIFIGVPEDIPDKRFGFFLPNRRQYAKAHYKFIGSLDLILKSIRTERQLEKNWAMVRIQ